MPSREECHSFVTSALCPVLPDAAWSGMEPGPGFTASGGDEGAREGGYVSFGSRGWKSWGDEDPRPHVSSRDGNRSGGF